MVAVTRHNDCSLELIDYTLLDFGAFRLFVGKALAFMVKTFNLLINELKTVVHGKILWDVVDNKVKSSLEDPRRRKESWPRLNGIVESFGFRTHEEAWIAADLAQIGVAHLSLDYGIYEI